MSNMLVQLDSITSLISNVVWPIFIPFLLLVGVYICVQVLLNIKSLTTEKSNLNLKDIIPQVSVALGSMVGTGTIIGFLGALSILSMSGQIYVEAVALWALLGSIVLIPISYCETLVSKVVNMPPAEYIEKFVSKGASKLYIISLVVLYVFAIGGVQFSGMDAIVITTLEKISNIQLSEIERYIFIIVPLIAIIMFIVLRNNQKLFINSMIGMILVSSIVYILFFGIFLLKTNSYIPIFIEKMIIGFRNPVSMILGVPLGLIFGMQRVIQIAEPALGTLALAASKTELNPRESALISSILTTILIFISVIVTSYIASYGMNEGIILFSGSSLERLVSYFETVISVGGMFGLIILLIFIMLSGMTTLLGSYFLLNIISKENKLKNNIMYLVFLILAGILSIFNFDILFNFLNILLFIATSLNMTALAMFTEFEWTKYKLKKCMCKKAI